MSGTARSGLFLTARRGLLTSDGVIGRDKSCSRNVAARSRADIVRLEVRARRKESGPAADIEPVNRQAQAADEQQRRQIDCHKRVNWKWKIHCAVPTSEVINHSSQEHVQQTPTDLGPFLDLRGTDDGDLGEHFATIRTLD